MFPNTTYESGGRKLLKLIAYLSTRCAMQLGKEIRGSSIYLERKNTNNMVISPSIFEKEELRILRIALLWKETAKPSKDLNNFGKSKSDFKLGQRIFHHAMNKKYVLQAAITSICRSNRYLQIRGIVVSNAYFLANINHMLKYSKSYPKLRFRLRFEVL